MVYGRFIRQINLIEMENSNRYPISRRSVVVFDIVFLSNCFCCKRWECTCILLFFRDIFETLRNKTSVSVLVCVHAFMSDFADDILSSDGTIHFCKACEVKVASEKKTVHHWTSHFPYQTLRFSCWKLFFGMFKSLFIHFQGICKPTQRLTHKNCKRTCKTS